MPQKTKGIVLSKIQYSDTGMIVQILTENFGKQSYLVYTTTSKKNGLRKNHFSVFMPLDLHVYHKQNGTLQKIKEASVDFHLNSISSSPSKTSILFFLSELISKIVKENETDVLLFNYIRNSLQVLELSTENCANFHVLFIFNLFKFLGLHPVNNYSESYNIFDIQQGRFTIGIPNHQNYIEIELSEKIALLFDLKLNESHLIVLKSYERTKIIDYFLTYCNFHLEKPGKLKSLEILKEIFS